MKVTILILLLTIYSCNKKSYQCTRVYHIGGFNIPDEYTFKGTPEEKTAHEIENTNFSQTTTCK